MIYNFRKLCCAVEKFDTFSIIYQIYATYKIDKILTLKHSEDLSVRRQILTMECRCDAQVVTVEITPHVFFMSQIQFKIEGGGGEINAK